MKLGNSIITASFVSRPNRFTVFAKQDGKTLLCYFPNPGRLRELLKPNATVALNHCLSPTRKTDYDLVAISTGRRWVSIDSRIPNQIVKEALRDGNLQEFRSYREVIPESVLGNSRIDFLLKSKGRSCLLEVKSCTLVTKGVATFPDAPTTRGPRHLLDLIRAKRAGFRSCVMFVIQRSDALKFTPNRATDPEFAEALRLAKSRGVEIQARRCNVRTFHISLGERVPVSL